MMTFYHEGLKEKTEELRSFGGFHVGDYFIITSSPISWNSLANKKCPYEYEISYPYKGKIKKILQRTESHDDGYNYVTIGMTEGKYGWSLDSLISEGIIIHNTKKQRSKKLKKINKTTKNK